MKENYRNVKCVHIATIQIGQVEAVCELALRTADCMGFSCPHYGRHTFIPEICEAGICDGRDAGRWPLPKDNWSEWPWRRISLDEK